MSHLGSQVFKIIMNSRLINNSKKTNTMKKTLITCTVLTVILCSCNTNLVGNPEPDARLKVNITNSASTRALIEENRLPDGSEVGITVLETDYTDYDGISAFKNVKYTASTQGSSQVWSGQSEIILSTTKGTLFAYYPYSESVTDITAVPVQATSTHQTDYMYAAPVTELNNKNATANVTMKHALAAVRLSITRGSFSGTGKVTSVGIKGDAVATSASLNTITGALSAFTGKGTEISPAFEAFTLSGTQEVKDFIVIPTGEEKSLTIRMEIDGYALEAQTPAIDFAEGVISHISVAVNSHNIGISGVSVTPWTDLDKGSLEIM